MQWGLKFWGAPRPQAPGVGDPRIFRSAAGSAHWTQAALAAQRWVWAHQQVGCMLVFVQVTEEACSAA